MKQILRRANTNKEMPAKTLSLSSENFTDASITCIMGVEMRTKIPRFNVIAAAIWSR